MTQPKPQRTPPRKKVRKKLQVDKAPIKKEANKKTWEFIDNQIKEIGGGK